MCPDLLGQYLQVLHALPNTSACSTIFFFIKLTKVVPYTIDELLELFILIHILNLLVFKLTFGINIIKMCEKKRKTTAALTSCMMRIPENTSGACKTHRYHTVQKL